MTLREIKELARLTVRHRQDPKRLLRSYFFRAAERFTPYVAVESNGTCYFVDTTDHVVGQETFIHGAFDRRAMTKALDLVHSHTGSSLRGKCFVDAGANIGTTTVAALKEFGAAEVIAFEPAPRNVRLLEQNVLANDLVRKVEVLELALSDHDGEAVLELAPSNSGDHRVRVARRDAMKPSLSDRRDAIVVRTARFDTLVEQGCIDLSRVGVVWMDCQGHEGQVLTGATRLLQSEIPVVLEYWPHGLRQANGLTRLNQLVAAHYSHLIDLGQSSANGEPRIVAASTINRLSDRYPDGAFTDLVLLK